MHQVEYLACVPYLYNKILQGEVHASGQQIHHNFYMAVRYLQYDIAYDLTNFETDLTTAGAIKQMPLGGDSAWLVSMKSAFEIGMKGLRLDPYYLLATAPSFVQGVMPFDGTTIEREGTAPKYFLA